MNQIDFLEAQNRSLTHADEERSKAVQKVKELELKNKKLHQIILENGGGVVGPPEEEVLAKFRELNQIINRMIHKYYSGATGCRINTAKEPQPSKAFWDMMSKDLVGAKKTLWFRALVANLIYEQLFHPDYPIFGLDSADIPQESEHCMVSVEKQLVKSKKGSYLVLKDNDPAEMTSNTWLFQQYRMPILLSGDHVRYPLA